MTTDTSGLAEKIYDQARHLPPESLLDLARYVEFLQFKIASDPAKQPTMSGALLTRLDGILEGYDFSPELLAEARQELWHGFGNVQP